MWRTDSWKRPWTWNNRLVLTVASLPVYRFLRGQVRCSGIPISLRIFYISLWFTQSKVLAEIDVFLEFSCFLYNPTDVGNLISGSSAFSKSSFCIWKFLVPILLKPGLDNFEHYVGIVRWVQLCSSLNIFDIAILWDWSESWRFPVLWPLLSFPNLLTYWVQHFHSIIFQDLK